MKLTDLNDRLHNRNVKSVNAEFTKYTSFIIQSNFYAFHETDVFEDYLCHGKFLRQTPKFGIKSSKLFIANISVFQIVQLILLVFLT